MQKRIDMNEQKQKNVKLSKIEKIFYIPVYLFAIVGVVFIIYFIITTLDQWKMYLLLTVIGVTAKYLVSSLKMMMEANDRISNYFVKAISSLALLTLSVALVYGLVKDYKQRLSYKKISNKEIIESLQKSKEEVKNALIGIDGTIDTLNDTKNKIDIVIAQAQTHKEDFLNQIDKLNKAGEIASGLDNKAREVENELTNVQKVIGGKGILTIEEFEKNKIRDLVIAFFLGIFASIIASLIVNIFKGKRKVA